MSDSLALQLHRFGRAMRAQREIEYEVVYDLHRERVQNGEDRPFIPAPWWTRHTPEESAREDEPT